MSNDGSLVLKITRHADKPIANWRPGKLSRLHAAAAVGETTQLCVNESWNDPGVGAPTHHHPDGLEEILMVLAGKGDFWVDGEHAVLEAGDSIVFPPFSHHGFVNVGEEQLHVLGIFAAAAPQAIYDDEPDRVVVIGGTSGERIDDTRVVQGPG